MLCHLLITAALDTPRKAPEIMRARDAIRVPVPGDFAEVWITVSRSRSVIPTAGEFEMESPYVLRVRAHLQLSLS